MLVNTYVSLQKSMYANIKSNYHLIKNLGVYILRVNLLISCYQSICLEHCFIWLRDLKLRKLEHKYLESFEMWCWRRMEKIKWSEKVTNEQVLDRIGEKRTLLNNILCRKANWNGHILR